MTGATKRINRGRGHSYVLDGETVPGVTTIIKTAFPPKLDNWSAEQTALFCHREREALAGLSEFEYVTRAKNARFETSRAAAMKGTQIHAHAEELARTGATDVDDEHRGHVEQYAAFLDAWEPETVEAERTVFSRRYRYAGTFDLVARIPKLGDGTVLLDVKTGKAVYGETALQLAAYRYADIWLDDDGAEHNVGDLEIAACGVIWLGPDAWELRLVDAGADTFRTFLYGIQTAAAAPELRDLIGEPEPIP